MKKLALGLTAALALGAMAVPNIASAAPHYGGGGGGGHMSMSRGGGGNVARSFGGNRNFANVPASRNFANVQNRNFNGRNIARINNGQRWAWSGRHHRHHRGWGYPAAALGAYGLYSAYDNCWDTVWTPSGYQRVYVCGPDDYGYY